jgi:hypothetical protein
MTVEKIEKYTQKELKPVGRHEFAMSFDANAVLFPSIFYISVFTDNEIKTKY